MTLPNKPVVLANTQDISTERWHEIRATGLGGSDAGTVLGENNYKSPLTLWAEKRGELPDQFTGNEATAWGHLLEEPIARRFAEVTGLAVIAWPVILQHPIYDWMLANVDYFVSDNAEEYELGTVTLWQKDTQPTSITHVLEIKTAGIASRGNPRAWQNDAVPSAYYWQGAHYANVTGIKQVYFAALVAGEGLVIRERQYDKPTLDGLIEAEAAFWECVEYGNTPEPVGSDDEADTIKALYPENTTEEYAEADDFLLTTLEDYVTLKARLDEQTDELRRLRSNIELAIGETSGIALEGRVLVTYKASKAGETFDAKAFKEAHPDLAATFTKVRPGVRTLRVKEVN